jgi:hypothetical protein
MKEYNHKTRKWEEKTEKVGSLKRPETCKGKKPHEFELALPKHVETTHTFSPEEVAKFYKISEEVTKFDNKKDEEARLLGVRHSTFGYIRVVRYFYKCAKCGKEKYE